MLPAAVALQYVVWHCAWQHGPAHTQSARSSSRAWPGLLSSHQRLLSASSHPRLDQAKGDPWIFLLPPQTGPARLGWDDDSHPKFAEFAHRATIARRRLPPRPLVARARAIPAVVTPQTHAECIIITYISYATASDEHYRACRYTDGGPVLARERVMEAAIWSCSGLSDLHRLPLREPARQK